MATIPVTCISVPLWHRQQWLEKELHFIREGDDIRIEVLNSKNGRPFCIANMDKDEFANIAKQLSFKPGD